MDELEVSPKSAAAVLFAANPSDRLIHQNQIGVLIESLEFRED